MTSGKLRLSDNYAFKLPLVYKEWPRSQSNDSVGLSSREAGKLDEIATTIPHYTQKKDDPETHGAKIHRSHIVALKSEQSMQNGREGFRSHEKHVAKSDEGEPISEYLW